MNHRFPNRRDMVHAIGRRARLLSPFEAATAWHSLAEQLIDMGGMDMPKFKHLIEAVRTATIAGRR